MTIGLIPFAEFSAHPLSKSSLQGFSTASSTLYVLRPPFLKSSRQRNENPGLQGLAWKRVGKKKFQRMFFISLVFSCLSK